MHELIMINKQQADEMKKILEIFPESVLIHSKDPDTKKVSFWTNNQFENYISKTHDNIEKLDQILVKLTNEVNGIQQNEEQVVETLSSLMNKHRQCLINEAEYK